MSRMYVWTEDDEFSSVNYITIAVCAVDIHEARKKVRSRVYSDNKHYARVYMLTSKPPDKICRSGVYTRIN